jgi:C1A family cysteine protease
MSRITGITVYPNKSGASLLFATIISVLASPAVFSLQTVETVQTANHAEVVQVQRAIARSKGEARWVASTTSMTLMSPGERAMRLGVSVPVPTNRQYAATGVGTITYPSAITGSSAPPASFDWRNVNGHSYVTTIRNQGSCGSCWAFASTAAMESKALISMNTPDVDLNLAEQTLVSCSGAGSCNGGQVNRVSDYLQKTGEGAETTFPYLGKDAACSSAQAGWQTNAFKISNWQYVYNKYSGTGGKLTIAMIKNALYNSGPLPVTHNVHSDFFAYKSGVYSVTKGATMQGRHAVTLVGWDDATQALIAKNSWGTGWGDNGYFRVGYDQIDGTGSPMEFGQEVLAYGSANSDGGVCLYSLAQSSHTAAATASSGSVDLTVKATGITCPWTATSSATWLTITAGANGSGNGKVSFGLAANTTAQTRIGTIKVADQTFTVTQAASSQPLPNCTLTSSATELKAGASATLTATCSPKATSYTWTNTGFAGNVAGGKVNPTKTTTYSVKGMNSAGTSNLASVTVTMAGNNPPPTCTLTASSTSVVPGTAVKLTTSCTPAATSWTWGNTGFAASAAGGNVTPTATTTYTVSGNNSVGSGKVASTTVTVVLPAPPRCSLTASSNSIKTGASATLSAKCIPVATSYLWTNSGFANNVATGTVKPDTTTTYSVVGVNAGGKGEIAKTTITLSTPIPLAPSQLSAPAGTVTVTTPTFSWNASAGANDYTLKLSSPSTSMSVKMSAASLGCGVGTGTCAVKPASALQANVTYSWSVQASNSTGTSPASAVKSFQIVLSKDGKTYPKGDYDAGPISSNAHAQQICPAVCSSKGLKWNGNWATTVPGKTSVCGCGN